MPPAPTTTGQPHWSHRESITVETQNHVFQASWNKLGLSRTCFMQFRLVKINSSHFFFTFLFTHSQVSSGYLWGKVEWKKISDRRQLLGDLHFSIKEKVFLEYLHVQGYAGSWEEWKMVLYKVRAWPSNLAARMRKEWSQRMCRVYQALPSTIHIIEETCAAIFDNTTEVVELEGIY